VGGNGRFFSNPTFAIPTTIGGENTRAIVDFMLVDVPNGFYINGMSLQENFQNRT
jgi:hypothetical protein